MVWTQGLRDFLKKILDFFDVEEERNLPGNYGRSNTQLRTGCEQKGTLFEKYLISRVDTANYFGVADWTLDICEDGVCPESNCNPDILMWYRRTGDKFALEYKYCSRHYYSEKYYTQTVRRARPDRIENYLRYQKEQNVLVYGVMGVENDILPGEPLKELFCVMRNDSKNTVVQIRKRIFLGCAKQRASLMRVFHIHFSWLIMRDFSFGDSRVSLREIRKQYDSIMGLWSLKSGVWLGEMWCFESGFHMKQTS